MKTYILLDRSGSMESNWDETLGAINGYVSKLEGRQDIFLAVFDKLGFDTETGMAYEVIRNGSKSKWKKLTRKEVEPRGGTPLNDALAETALRMLEEGDQKAVLVVMTDGHENASNRFSTVATKALLDRIRAREWQVVFLGANFDDIKAQAQSYGVDYARRGLVTTSGNYGATFSNLAGKVNAYNSINLSAGAQAVAATMDWSDQEQEEAKK